MRRIVVSSDHAGFELKQVLKEFLQEQGYQVEDVGTCSTEPVDYPEFTKMACERVASGEFSRGIIFCGTGQGDAMVANKIPGIRAALCWDTFTAELSRAHNDSNVLVLGGWLIGRWLAREIIRVWLATPFDGGRHERRIRQMMAIEHHAHLHYRKVYDVSLTVAPGMAVWPGDPAVSIEAAKSITSGNTGNISMLHMGSHTGTHVDAPRHFLPSGTGIDAIDPSVLLGRARVFQLPKVQYVDRALLEGLDLQGVKRAVLGTRNSALQKQKRLNLDYAYISNDAAQYLVELGVKLVGIDYLSIEEYQKEGHPTHMALLGAGLVIVEGLDLTDVPPGDYEILCLPLKIKDGDGAPARVLLREL
ncbi:MAG: ribose 5-phosphate isomerase B [Chloroflexi bacterium]|nr:ribose 5-phosphate isomerase B [Chloroflexota bacterium]